MARTEKQLAGDLKRKGAKRSAETRAKMSAAATGRPRSDKRIAADQAWGKKPRSKKWLLADLDRAVTLSGRPKSAKHLANLVIAAAQPRTAKQAAALGATSAANKGKPLSAEHRAKISAAHRTPENRARLARYREAWVSTEGGKAQCARNYQCMGWFSKVGKELRKRDGDLCQLCLEPIDFTVHKSPLTATVDHKIPVRGGGLDALENFWLAHRFCNQSKGARWAGRKDGSTDSRRKTLAA